MPKTTPPTPTLVEVQRQLLIDATTAEAARTLAGHCVSFRLLKGAVLASWLYQRAHDFRPYVDIDLLVPPKQLPAARSVLREIGFEDLTDQSLVEAFAEPHSAVLKRAVDGVAIDLHWRLPGIAANGDEAWEVLAEAPGTIRIADVSIDTLSEPGRLLHLALHAVQNGVATTKPVEDLRRGVLQVGADEWRLASKVAFQLDAAEPFGVGLRMCPEGRALADELNLPEATSARWHLWAQTPPPGATRLQALLDTAGARGKLIAVRRGIAPSPAYMRAIYPGARRSRWGLIVAYAVRPIPVLVNAIASVRAVRRARKSASADQGD